jgi:hypothetical protein
VLQSVAKCRSAVGIGIGIEIGIGIGIGIGIAEVIEGFAQRGGGRSEGM